MALLFCSGFDYFTSVAHLDQIFNATRVGNWTINASGGRRGGGAATLDTAQGWIGRILPATYTTLIAGVAYSQIAAPASPGPLVRFGDGGLTDALTQVTIAVDTNLAIRAYRGGTFGTLLGTSANNAIIAGSYQYVEPKVSIHASAGTVEVKVNGVTVLNLTGQNTKNTANSTISQCGPASPAASTGLWDDFYICDTSGPDNNNFLGDCRVDTCYPTGDGFYLQWTPSTPGTHFNMVNAHPPQIVNNVSDNVVGHKDSYDVTNLPSITGTIYGVQLVHYAMKSDAGSRSFQPLVRSGLVDQAASAIALGTGVNLYPTVIERDPLTTAPWTQAGFNAAQFGQQTA